SQYVSPINTIWAFGKEDIWFDGVIKWNGKVLSVHMNNFPLLPNGDGWRVNAMWGTTSEDFYVVGNNGNIAHYDGSPSGTGWKKIESGTSTDINDIWGIANKFTKQVEIYCAVSEFFEPKDKKILRISFNNKVDSIPWGPDRYVVTVWTATGFPIYAGGDGIFVNKRNEWKEVNLGVNYMSNQIRGYKLNDVFVVGHFGLFAHFNGSTWKVYKEVYNAIYGSLSVKNNLIVAVGERNGKGVITIGRRN
ncbi:MAG: glucosyl transferase, partial [Bacteroidota bacterium]